MAPVEDQVRVLVALAKTEVGLALRVTVTVAGGGGGGGGGGRLARFIVTASVAVVNPSVQTTVKIIGAPRLG